MKTGQKLLSFVVLRVGGHDNAPSAAALLRCSAQLAALFRGATNAAADSRGVVQAMSRSCLARQKQYQSNNSQQSIYQTIAEAQEMTMRTSVPTGLAPAGWSCKSAGKHSDVTNCNSNRSAMGRGWR